MDQRLKYKSQTTNVLEENVEGNLHVLGFGNDFLAMASNHKQPKKKKKIGLHQNRKHLCFKGHHQESEKGNSLNGENICKSYT